MNFVKDTIIKAAIKAAGSKFCSVTFIKKTGDERTITFNPKEGVKLVTGERAEAVANRKANNPTLINVVDTSIANKQDARKSAWRSFDTQTVVSMKVDGVDISFN